MKTMMVMLLIAAVGTGLWAYLASRWSSRRDDQQYGNVSTELPARLKGAKVWAKEKDIACRMPRRIHGRLDESFELAGSEIIVSETKTRKKPVVYRSDVIQASLIGLTLANGSAKSVSGTGYIRLITPGGNKYVEIKLLPEAELVSIYDSYKRISAGLEPGDRCANRALCASCEYKKECSAM